MPSSNSQHPGLSDLPSGRPRRLLLFTSGLQPDDATLRAFDLARHLHAHGHWFARVISGTDGPLRAEFEAAAIPVQVVDTPTDPSALARQVWGARQDAAIAFNEALSWAEPLARTHRLPLLHETQASRAWFDPYASPSPRDALRHQLALPAGERLALAFATETADEPRFLDLLTAVNAALREAALADWHLGLIGADGSVQILTPDGGRKSVPRTLAARSAWVAAAEAVFDLQKHGTGFRPIFDAAALAVPIIAEPTATLTTLLPASLVAPAELGSPTDAADALIDLVLNPGASTRRVASAHVFAMTHLNPARLLPTWIAELERVVASASR